MNSESRARIPALFAAAIAVAPCYELLRVTAWAVGGAPDPRFILFTQHAAFLWRTALAAYLAGFVGLSMRIIPLPFGRWLTRHGVAIVSAVATVTITLALAIP